ncbi:MAG: TraB/GumN family protein [Thermoplasmata archaeon]
MITLLGVSHVFRLGPRIHEEIARRRPDLIALELDPLRLQTLDNPDQVRRIPGVYSLLAAFQRRIAEEYGAGVGEEMLAARDAGRHLGIPVALIDVDSRLTWRDLWASLRPLELLKLAFSALGSLFVGREQIERELHRYQEDYAGFMDALARDYPAVKEVLVDRRNAHMAGELKRLQEAYPRIVAVVGDGHVQGLTSLLDGEEVEVVRLWDLRPTASKPAPDTRVPPS